MNFMKYHYSKMISEPNIASKTVCITTVAHFATIYSLNYLQEKCETHILHIFLVTIISKTDLYLSKIKREK